MSLDETLLEAGTIAVDEALQRLQMRQQPIPGPTSSDGGGDRNGQGSSNRAQTPPGRSKRAAESQDGREPHKRRSIDPRIFL